MRSLETTVHSVWKKTLKKEGIQADYIEQLKKRLDNVYSVHPEFQNANQNLCGKSVENFENLLERAEKN